MMQQFWKNEDGVASVGGLFWVILILMLSGIVIDSANGWRTKAQLRATTDAAALAAAQHLDDPAAARAAAIAIAEANMDPLVHGDVVGVEDVIFGHYSSDGDSFTLDDVDPTAVQVISHRSEANGNGLRTFLLGMIGVGTLDVEARSVAEGTRGFDTEDPNSTAIECADTIILSDNQIELGGQATIDGAHCIHGAQGVTSFGGDLIAGGAQISAEQLSTVALGANAAGSQPESIYASARNWPLAILPQASTQWALLYDMLEDAVDTNTLSYSGPLLPDFLTQGSPDPWPIVHVNGDITYGSTDDLSGKIIFVEGNVTFAEGFYGHDFVMLVHGAMFAETNAAFVLDRAYITSEGQIDFTDADMFLGRDTWCEDAYSRVYLISLTSISISHGPAAANNGPMVPEMWGATLASPYLNIAGGLTAAGGLYVETSSYTNLGGPMNLTACANTMANIYPLNRPQSGVTTLADLPSISSAQLVR